MASRIRNARRHNKTHVSGFVLLAITASVFIALVAGIFSGIKLLDSWLQDLPDYTNTDSYLAAEPTNILDADGNVIASLYLQNRKTITKDEVSPWVLKATVSTEDERFYQHHGVDLYGIARAAFKTLAGQGMEGASTITQQLVRNTILSDEQFEKSLRRKVREAYIALELEKRYSKEQILMMYINTIYYGSGAYGIEAAAETYLGKHAKDLSMTEAALLCGLPQSPNKLNPNKNPEEAKKRRNTVLRRLLSNNQINEEEFNQAVKEDIKLNYTPPSDNGTMKFPYFVDYVKSILLKEYPRDILFQSGLTVKTTIKPKLQAAAEASVNSVLGDDTHLEAALVCIDPKTGNILAMVGGRNYKDDQFNVATQARRQPGSSFKTFTLVAALEAGLDPDTLVNAQSPVQITPKWTVKNFANESAGIVSVREATWRSLNTAYARIAHSMGPRSIVDTAKKMGITSRLDAVDAITLGVSGVSPLEMASAYATLANDGVYMKPVAITEILDRKGGAIYKAPYEKTQVLDPKIAAAATDVLKGVMTQGTGRSGNPNNGQEVAGKTGTSQNIRDLWLCAYTPQYSTSVWVGARKETAIKFKGANGSTRSLPSPIWKAYMSKALEGLPHEKFPTHEAPSYRDDLNWDLGPTHIEEPVDLNFQGLNVKYQLETQYPGYQFVIKSVESNEAAGTVLQYAEDPVRKEIILYVSKGPNLPEASAPKEEGENATGNEDDFSIFGDSNGESSRR